MIRLLLIALPLSFVILSCGFRETTGMESPNPEDVHLTSDGGTGFYITGRVGVIPLESIISVLEDESGQDRWMILILLTPTFLGALVLVAVTYEFRNREKKMIKIMYRHPRREEKS